MGTGELQDLELFSFTDILLFMSVFYKRTSKNPLMFRIVLRLHQVQIRGYFILHVVHITGTRIIVAGIDVLSKG